MWREDVIGYFAINGTYNSRWPEGGFRAPADVLPMQANQLGPIDTGLTKANDWSLLDPVYEALETQDTVVVVLGTDTLEDVAYFFARSRPRVSTRVFLVGAMLPHGHPESDFAHSLSTLVSVMDQKGPGSWVVVGYQVHDGAEVRKACSVTATAFQSSLRLGWRQQPRFAMNDSGPAYAIRPGLLTANVPIVMLGLGMEAQPAAGWYGLDGLVIAAPGTGTLPDDVFDDLAPMARKMPIAITTRCMDGPNQAEALYPGSVKRYEDAGFIVTAMSGLNPIQARIELQLQLASH